ncbi:hypothetical protein DPEC_G00256890 [Dallia pectoralis]|uniref:Uncharacterized protein n=1 Tax=Dallia pectoralis TaxID=75939 RepID=A0ACC2FQF9_DALPE|nr:hypothetical protein DPEC_G00256890 [Dallia pectoralis]
MYPSPGWVPRLPHAVVRRPYGRREGKEGSGAKSGKGGRLRSSTPSHRVAFEVAGGPLIDAAIRYGRSSGPVPHSSGFPLAVGAGVFKETSTGARTTPTGSARLLHFRVTRLRSSQPSQEDECSGGGGHGISHKWRQAKALGRHDQNDPPRETITSRSGWEENSDPSRNVGRLDFVQWYS